MAKVVRCRDVGFDCDGVVRAETEEEALKIATGKYPGIKEVSHDCYLAAGNVPYGQKLVWYVIITGEPVNNIYYGGTAAVDATDGNGLSASGFA